MKLVSNVTHRPSDSCNCAHTFTYKCLYIYIGRIYRVEALLFSPQTTQTHHRSRYPLPLFLLLPQLYTNTCKNLKHVKYTSMYNMCVQGTITIQCLALPKSNKLLKSQLAAI